MQSTRLDPKHEAGIMPIDPPTPYTRYAGLDSPRGRVLVIHGLDVSKNTTHLIFRLTSSPALWLNIHRYE